MVHISDRVYVCKYDALFPVRMARWKAIAYKDPRSLEFVQVQQPRAHDQWVSSGLTLVHFLYSSSLHPMAAQEQKKTASLLHCAADAASTWDGTPGYNSEAWPLTPAPDQQKITLQGNCQFSKNRPFQDHW